MPAPTIGICIGHSRIGDSGAVNTAGVSEHKYNSQVGKLFAGLLDDKGFKPVVIDHYPRSSYSSAMRWVADELVKKGATVAVELHFNSATPFANGHEWLYWHRSVKGQKLASSFNDAFREEFPNNRARGVKPIDSRDRGGAFLHYTRCPAIILEPYFGSNKAETEQFMDQMPELASVYATAIVNYFK